MSRFTTTLAFAATLLNLIHASPIPLAAPQDAPWQTASWQSAPWQTASWQSAPWQTAPGQTVPGGPGNAEPTPTVTSAPTTAPAAITTSVAVQNNVVNDNAVEIVTDVVILTVTDITYATVLGDGQYDVHPTQGGPPAAPTSVTFDVPAPSSPAPEAPSTTTTVAAPAPTTVTSIPAPVEPMSTTSTTSTTPVYTPPASTSTPPASVYTPPAAPSSSTEAAPAQSSSSSSGSGSGTVYNGIATINPNPTNALGSCGGSTGDSTFTVALSPSWIKSWNSPLCNGQIRLTNTGPSTDNSIGGKGNSVVVTIMDTCEGCDSTHLDLSTAAWNQLTNSAADSQVSISWEFI